MQLIDEGRPAVARVRAGHDGHPDAGANRPFREPVSVAELREGGPRQVHHPIADVGGRHKYCV